MIPWPRADFLGQQKTMKYIPGYEVTTPIQDEAFVEMNMCMAQPFANSFSHDDY